MRDSCTPARPTRVSLDDFKSETIAQVIKMLGWLRSPKALPEQQIGGAVPGEIFIYPVCPTGGLADQGVASPGRYCIKGLA